MRTLEEEKKKEMRNRDDINIYQESSEVMSKSYNERIAIYNSIRKGMSIEEEIIIFSEIARLDFHTIPYSEIGGNKQSFLRGFLKGLEWAQKIVENRNKPEEEQIEVSASLSYYF